MMTTEEPNQHPTAALIEGVTLRDLVSWEAGANTVLDHIMRRVVQLAEMDPMESISLFESSI